MAVGVSIVTVSEGFWNMKIYLAVAASGGWSLLSLSRLQDSLLISYHYDMTTLKEYQRQNHETIFSRT